MRSLASLLFLIIIMFPIFIFYNKKLENIKPPKLIKYRPIDTNIIDMQFDTYKIKKESIKNIRKYETSREQRDRIALERRHAYLDKRSSSIVEPSSNIVVG
jgi:hypothetical protein